MLSKPPDGDDAEGGEEEGVYIEDGNSVKPTKEGLDIIEKHYQVICRQIIMMP